MRSPLVDPEVLGRVSRLELVARHAVEGFLSGRHPSPYYGSSVEYADHRPYSLGDEIRAIDWKILAKTDKHYIKLYAEQTNTRCVILVDASGSMGFGTGSIEGPASKPRPPAGASAGSKPAEAPAPGTTKLEYACRLAAALAYLLVRQNDAVGLGLFDREVRTYLPPRSTPSHFRTLVDFMEQARPGGDSRIGPVLHELGARVRRRGMIVLISALLDEPDAIKEGLTHFRFHHHEVIVFHVMDPAELEFPYEKLTKFKDLEGAGTVITNPRTVRKRYLQRLDEFRSALRISCLERGVSYELARTDTPYDQMLSAFLEKRMKMKKG